MLNKSWILGFCLLFVLTMTYHVDGSGIEAALQPMTRDIRIVGGSVARQNQFPHSVALILHLRPAPGERQPMSSFCGGSVIHASYILTAAHCMDDLLRLEVLAGVHNIFANVQQRQNVDARDCRQHPRYSTETLLNDIGLVFLRRRLTFSASIQPIALPTRAQRNNRFTGGMGTIVGWGRTRDNSQALSNQLRFVSLPIVADAVCERVYNVDYRYFTPSNICIDGSNGSSCNGDSGSGMHLKTNGRMTLIGVVSYGSATCETGHPIAMSRVTSYLDWIASNTGLRP